jgi:protein-tyrosine-phosphatase
MEVAAGRQNDAHRPYLLLSAAVLFIACIASLAARTAPAQESKRDPKGGKAPTVLFMCPHGAAKSVLASAYFQRLAKERGLNVRVESAGTEPDPTVSSAVAAHLKRQGYPLPVAKPRKVAPEQFASADVVISMGCDLRNLPQPRGRLIRWDDVPAPGEGLTAADDAIRKRVGDLLEELLVASGFSRTRHESPRSE